MAGAPRCGDPRGKEVKMEPYGNYTSVLLAGSGALLLIAAGLAKKQLVWKRRPPGWGRRRKP
jgi:hypothetical protein